MKDLLNNKIFKIIGISAIGLFIVTWLAGWVTGSDLGNFPFDANVWGTASDYYMILVTIVSAYFIFKTLKQQEQDSLRETLKNVAGFNYGINYSLEKLEFPSTYRLFITNTGHNVKNVRIHIEKLHRDKDEHVDKEMYRSYLKKDFNRGDINNSVKRAIQFYMSDNHYYLLKIEFQDQFLNNYQQKLIVTKNGVFQEQPYEYIPKK